MESMLDYCQEINNVSIVYRFKHGVCHVMMADTYMYH